MPSVLSSTSRSCCVCDEDRRRQSTSQKERPLLSFLRPPPPCRSSLQPPASVRASGDPLQPPAPSHIDQIQKEPINTRGPDPRPARPAAPAAALSSSISLDSSPHTPIHPPSPFQPPSLQFMFARSLVRTLASPIAVSSKAPRSLPYISRAMSSKVAVPTDFVRLPPLPVVHFFSLCLSPLHHVGLVGRRDSLLPSSRSSVLLPALTPPTCRSSVLACRQNACLYSSLEEQDPEIAKIIEDEVRLPGFVGCPSSDLCWPLTSPLLLRPGASSLVSSSSPPRYVCRTARKSVE